MAINHRTSPLGIVELTRATFDHLASQGRIDIDSTGTPYVDISGDSGEPCWVPCQLIAECLCKRTSSLRTVCPVHGGDS